MTNVDELLEEELQNLQVDEEVYDLETLITDGRDAKIPIVIEYPRKDGVMVKAGALIRPLTNVEWNNATRLRRNPNDTTTNELELVKKALYTKSGEQFPPELVTDMPNGVIMELVKEIAKISGVNLQSKENIRMAKEMMGF